MSRPLVQIGDEVREMNDAEYAQFQLDAEAQAIEMAEIAAKIEARTSALAKLSALGLTETEIAALVGQ